jgi:hypothetical protein
MPHSGLVTIDYPTLPSRQHEVNNIKDYGFRFGDIGGRRMTFVPLSPINRRNWPEYFVSRSMIRYRLEYSAAACESVTCVQSEASTIRQVG